MIQLFAICGRKVREMYQGFLNYRGSNIVWVNNGPYDDGKGRAKPGDSTVYYHSAVMGKSVKQK
jgi:hypothetical protein